MINKVDLAAAQPELVAEEIEHVLGIRKNECFRISAKTGVGVKDLLDAVCELLPPPADRSDGADAGPDLRQPLRRIPRRDLLRPRLLRLA